MNPLTMLTTSLEGSYSERSYLWQNIFHQKYILQSLSKNVYDGPRRQMLKNVLLNLPDVNHSEAVIHELPHFVTYMLTM